MTSLRSIALERVWPTAASDVLAFTELKQDPLYEYIRPNQILTYIEGASAFGRQAAEKLTYDGNLAPLMMQIAESGTKVAFLDEIKRDGDKLIRAQYEHKPPVVYVYRPSLEQMDNFFLRSGFRVDQEDLMALHMCHEWFHHLEQTRIGRTDQQLPKLVMRRVGPVTFKQGVESSREIAAHAFTQQVMGLPWSPLLLDVLIAQTERRMKKSLIRDYFHQLKSEFERATVAEMTPV